MLITSISSSETMTFLRRVVGLGLTVSYFSSSLLFSSNFSPFWSCMTSPHLFFFNLIKWFCSIVVKAKMCTCTCVCMRKRVQSWMEQNKTKYFIDINSKTFFFSLLWFKGGKILLCVSQHLATDKTTSSCKFRQQFGMATKS